MQKIQIKRYRIPAEKLEKSVKLCFLADWHASETSLSPSFLWDILRKEDPDAVLIGGDMVTAMNFQSMKIADRLLSKLSGWRPVYYVRGNHEIKLYRSVPSHKKYMEFEGRMADRGIHLLSNTHAPLEVRGQRIEIYGYLVPRGYYRKPFPPRMTPKTLERAIGSPSGDHFSILLAHTPFYAENYFRWGASLILCGHYHGGILRLDEHHGLMSPQLELFPRFCCGAHYRGNQVLITSAGIGEHGFMTGGLLDSLKMRYHNPREMITITLEPARTEKRQKYGA